MGTRYGCGLEQCGSCMVLVDGQPAYACTREVGTVADRKVTTIEGPGHAGQAASPAAGLPRRAGRPVRLLPERHRHVGQGAARPQSHAQPRRHRRRARPASLPLRRASAHPARGRTRGGHAAQWRPGMNARPLPASLVDNPRLDRWIHFQPDRTVRIATGKVEMGQGVVTAIGQIAADELDLPLDRVVVLSGDTDQRPGRALHDVVALDRGVGRLGAPGLRRGAGQGAGARRAASQLQPRRSHRGRRPVPAERRGDRAGLLDRRRRDRSHPGGHRHRAGEARFGLPRGRQQRAAPRPAGEAERCGLRPRRPAARMSCMPARCASPIAAPPWRRSTRPRSAVPPPIISRGRAADHPRGQLRGLRQPGRERRAGRRCRRAGARQVGQRAPPRAGAAGSGVAERSAERRPAHRRLAGARDADPAASCR